MTQEVKKKKGLITKEFYQYYLENHSSLERLPTDPLWNVNIGTKEYAPMFTIDFRITPTCRVSDLLTLDEDVSKFDKKYGIVGWKSNDFTMKFVKKAVGEGHYIAPLMMREGDQSLTASNNLVLSIMTRMNGWTLGEAPLNNLDRFSLAGSPVIEDVFRDITTVNKWSLHKMRKAPKAETRAVYLTNLMFLATIEDGQSVESSFIRGTYKPMFSMMIKRDNIPLVKAHFITNTAIPSSLVELWVDESVEAVGSKIKPYYRKLLKSKLEASGVIIKGFKDLGSEIIRALKLPKFRTTEDRETWLNEMLDECYAVKEGELVYDKPPAPRMTAPVKKVLDSFEEEMKALTI